MIPRQNCAVVCFCPIYLFTYVTYLPVLLSSAYTSILCRLLFTCLFICFFMLLYRIYYNKILNETISTKPPASTFQLQLSNVCFRRLLFNIYFLISTFRRILSITVTPGCPSLCRQYQVSVNWTLLNWMPYH